VIKVAGKMSLVSPSTKLACLNEIMTANVGASRPIKMSKIPLVAKTASSNELSITTMVAVYKNSDGSLALNSFVMP
jgi:hypothetical protein